MEDHDWAVSGICQLPAADDEERTGTAPLALAPGLGGGAEGVGSLITMKLTPEMPPSGPASAYEANDGAPPCWLAGACGHSAWR